MHGELVSYYQISNGPSVFLSFDQGGNTRVATGMSQANTGTFDYQAFGHIFRSTLGAFYVNLYAGQYGYLFLNAADVPMYYTQARWYDTTSGTWLSGGPIGFDGGDWSLYRNVGNESVGRVDPGGLAPLSKVICRQACASLFKKTKDLNACAFICKNLGGKECNSLNAYCNHLTRPTSEGSSTICGVQHVYLCSKRPDPVT